MSAIWGVSRGGYYDWLNRSESKRFQEDARVLEIMKKSYADYQGMCGLDKLLGDVREEIPTCSRNRVYRLQKQHSLYSIRKKPFKICTTDSNHTLPIADNILNQDFEVQAPNTVWVTDITYLQHGSETMYLAIVKDLYDKEIVGWSLDIHMRTELCLAALESAVKKRRPQAGLIHHSDRGSQYCSQAYQEALSNYHMICSMSRKGNCWDNACAETFFSTLKSERIRHQKYHNTEELRRDIFWYIEYFYNRHHRHQALGNITIPQFQHKNTNQMAA
ncbi:MAG: hypothetical protein H6Q67_1311 [Firmicutes bacterium]|nr:hypothetical protein [Bacillota bacterium]